jgi:hypothetical protein
MYICRIRPTLISDCLQSVSSKLCVTLLVLLVSLLRFSQISEQPKTALPCLSATTPVTEVRLDYLESENYP